MNAHEALLPRPVGVAVVIPVFRHAGLVVEALEAALAQVAPFGVAVVAVDDGCPHAETRVVLADYARAHPGRVACLRRPNGGLSAARNAGVEHALARFPALRAVYFLDADNRLRPGALARAMTALEADGADWVYPAIDMFGLPWAGDFGGAFSRLVQTGINPCEAGSLVHRRVFDAGVRFDAAMRDGFEDWDFFLSAAGAGFRGANLDTFGFRYRKRPESMLAESMRMEGALQHALGRKHAWMRSPRALHVIEHEEAPRYAIYLADTHVHRLTADPARPGREMTPGAFARVYWAARTAPGRHHVPPFVVATTTAALDALAAGGLLHGAFWRLERLLDHATLAVAWHDAEAVDVGVETVEDARGRHLDAGLVAIAPDCLDAVLADPMSSWIDTLVRPDCEPPVAGLRLRSPGPAPALSTSVAAPIHAFLGQIHALRRAPWREAAATAWDWRASAIPARSRAHRHARAPFEGEPGFPRLPAPGERHVGLLLPLVAFGGVEKVAIMTARALSAHGWTPHLIVLERESAALGPDWREAFESVCFLDEPGQGAWDGCRHYQGTDVPPWAVDGRHARALAALGWLDAVINCHGAAMHGAMGALRRLGVVTCASLHLADRTPCDRAVGHPYLGLAFEHAYDLFAPCSRGLADWLCGMGVPEAKVVAVENAPGYAMAEDEIAAVLDRRATRSTDRPLRALFLGRLDRQKGLDALAEAVRRTEAGAVEWRVVGKAVLDDGALPPALAGLVEPPASTPEALTRLYAWADVLVLPSRFEGLPLTVLEAMRLGVVPLASDVGALGEAVIHGETGLLVARDAGLARAMAEALAGLAADRDRLAALSRAAAAVARARDWQAATLPLARALDEAVAARRPARSPENAA